MSLDVVKVEEKEFYLWKSLDELLLCTIHKLLCLILMIVSFICFCGILIGVFIIRGIESELYYSQYHPNLQLIGTIGWYISWAFWMILFFLGGSYMLGEFIYGNQSGGLR